MSLETLSGKSGNGEKAVDKESKLTTKIESLKGLEGPDFINTLRATKNENPDFESFVETYKGNKRLKKDILNGLFYLAKENRSDDSPNYETPAFLKQIEQYYYPEIGRKNRRHDRKFFGTYGGILGALAIGGLVSYHEAMKQFDKEEKAEENWETQKLPLTIEEIEQQVDTIFQSIEGNLYLFSAYDTIRSNIEDRFEKVNGEFEKESRDKIVEYLDSLHTNNPQEFQDFVLEYWKSQNKMPNSYMDVAYHPQSTRTSIESYKNEYRSEKESREKNQNDLLERLRTAYKKVDGGKTEELVFAHEQLVKDQENETQTKKENDKKETNEESDKFRVYIDSLTSDAFQEYARVVNSQEGAEIKKMESEIKQILELSKQEINTEKKKIKDELSLSVRDIRNQDAQEFGLTTEKFTKYFTPDVWAYLEDYYLMNDVFDEYDGLSDTITAKELKTLENDPAIKEVLNKIFEDRSESEERIKDKISEATFYADLKADKIVASLSMRTNTLIEPIEAEFVTKNSLYSSGVKTALREYEIIYKDVWNKELKEQNIKNVKPIE